MFIRSQTLVGIGVGANACKLFPFLVCIGVVVYFLIMKLASVVAGSGRWEMFVS